MPITHDAEALFGRTVVNSDGDKIGKVDGVFLDDETAKPEWVAIKTGFFGSNVSLVPLAAAEEAGEDLRVPYNKQKVKDAPHHDPDQALSQSAEVELFEYYGVPYGGETITAEGGPQTGMAAGQATIGRDTSGRSTDDAMTRSEEELHVGRETREAGRARLRKYIVTEDVTRTVPISHEEVRVEREPITEANRDRAMAGPELSEEEHEVVLHEERPVVEKEVVAKERVRLGTETVTEEQQVSETLAKEKIETEGVYPSEGRSTTADESTRSKS